MKGFKASAVFPIVLASLGIEVHAEPLLIQGSDKSDFSIRCEKDGKVTLEIFDLNKDDSMRIARDIYIEDQGNGRSRIIFSHGFIVARDQSTYVTAPDENCSFSKRLI
ncbi:hypothetical protein PQS90_14910 [Pseudomonas sp. BLCC-B13]|uniref:hypothetical protein n=1 Tax=Pseudomonas sp. BLCC-B13 TaxID=3025314 RepID=UPI00234F6689|nr:hypothetical protein [Pseudomonas sp. BLCC-B13]MDC7826441.1 hypothetical protein [Pseudomonas sp. BLCC-B13]